MTDETCHCPCCREGIPAPHEYHLESRPMLSASPTSTATAPATGGEQPAPAADIQVVVVPPPERAELLERADRLASALRGSRVNYVVEQQAAQAIWDLIDALKDAALSAPAPAGDAPKGYRLMPAKVTEDMHVAAVKVLQRAHGLDGLPQRMLDAMLAASPTVPGDAPKGELISRDKLFVCPQAVNSVTRVTVEGEPAQAVPANKENSNG